MNSVTLGDVMHLTGGFGLGIDYAVRLSLRLADPIDAAVLADAVQKTQQRYPYLSVRLCRNETNYYYETNHSPVVLLNTAERITLNSAESNYHVWAVCHDGDRLFLDISHGICDGTGMYMVLSTLLYYYCSGRYGVTDHTGIRTLDDPVLPDESADPAELLPPLDPSGMPNPSLPEAFSLVNDGGLTPCEPVVYDIVIPEDMFLAFTSANDASPGTMISILFSRAIDELFPEREKPLTNSYIINARPMLGAPNTHHNCVHTVRFDYTDRIRAMPFDRQCTVHRGTTFLQSDRERVCGSMMVQAARNRMVEQRMPTLEAKTQAYAQMLLGGKRLFTYMVSYVGQWKVHSLAPYITEFWTHVPNANNLLTEIAAVNGKIYLSTHQNFREECVVRKFLELLERNNVPYTLRGPMDNDIARFPEPAAGYEKRPLGS